MPSPKRNIGDIGEGVASNYLKKRGFVIIERNYWKPWGEIDLIVTKDNRLRFVEVKSVSRGTIRPEENMHPAKLKRLYRAIQTYLLDKRIADDQEWQIDLVCVSLDFSSRKAKVELVENIVL